MKKESVQKMDSFVVLHYNNIKVTEMAIDRLLSLCGDKAIVIVDNGSPDRSGLELKRIYDGNPEVTVLLVEKNKGFAVGNNIGFLYAKQHFASDLIIVMNSDVLIDDGLFLKKTKNYLNKTGLDVVGPDIITPDKRHQNPLLKKRKGSAFYFKMLIISSIRLFFLKAGIFTKNVQRNYHNHSLASSNMARREVDARGCVLHGSIIAFGPRYCKQENMAFLPYTFLYGEELLLADYLYHKGYICGVCRETQVSHMVGQSSVTDEYAKFKLRLLHETKSYWLILKQRLKYAINGK